MINNKFKIKSKVREYAGPSTYYFLDLPKKLSSEIKVLFADYRRGWGSLQIMATIGKTTWKTSIFPDNKSGTYFLLLKKEVRKKEEISDGDVVDLHFKVII